MGEDESDHQFEPNPSFSIEPTRWTDYVCARRRPHIARRVRIAENLLVMCKENPVSERMSDSRSFEVLTANPVRLSSSPARSYRSWSDEEKGSIVGESLVAGANVSAIARSNGLDPAQLFAWRRTVALEKTLFGSRE